MVDKKEKKWPTKISAKKWSNFFSSPSKLLEFLLRFSLECPHDVASFILSRKDGGRGEKEEELTTNKHRLLLLLLLLLGLLASIWNFVQDKKSLSENVFTCCSKTYREGGVETDVQASEEGKKVFFDFFPFGKLTRLSPAEREGICLRAKRGRTGKRKREGGWKGSNFPEAKKKSKGRSCCNTQKSAVQSGGHLSSRKEEEEKKFATSFLSFDE